MQERHAPGDERRDDTARVARSSLRWAVGVALVSGLGAAVYRHYLNDVLDFLGHYYERNSPGEVWRQQDLDNRLIGYADFLPLLSVAAFLLALAIRYGSNQRFGDGLTAVARRWVWWVTPVLVVLWAHDSSRVWEEYGNVCWDQYCDYAQLFANLFTGKGSAPLLQFMHTNYHSNSPFVPVVTALLSLVTRLPIVDAYRLSCGLATLTTLWLVAKVLGRRLGNDGPFELAVVVLFGTHMAVMRSSFFPQTDAWVLLWTTILLVLALDRLTRPAVWQWPVLVAVLTSGLFLKLSFLPALALIPLVEVYRLYLSGERSPTVMGRRFAVAFVLCSALPAAVFLGFQSWVGTVGQYAVEFRSIRTGDSHVLFIVAVVIQTAAFAVPPVLLGWREFKPSHWMLVVWIALYWLGLWASGASGWNRFYLASIPALALLTIPGLRRLGRSVGPAVVVCYVALVALLNQAGLHLGLYQ